MNDRESAERIAAVASGTRLARLMMTRDKDDCECGHARAEHERSNGRCGACYCAGFVRPLSPLAANGGA